MTISTVLSSIQSLLEANPIINEPGYEKLAPSDPVASAYAEVVQWRLACLVGGQLAAWRRTGVIPAVWVGFEDVLEERGEKMLERLIELSKAKAAEGERTYMNIPY
jgi:hypothetical protein